MRKSKNNESSLWSIVKVLIYVFVFMFGSFGLAYFFTYIDTSFSHHYTIYTSNVDKNASVEADCWSTSAYGNTIVFHCKQGTIAAVGGYK